MLPLLLIPGMMCDKRMWGSLPARLYPRQVIHFLPTGADTIEALAANALSQAPAEFALAGLSMGGIVAMEILRQAPERVERLALLDTNPLAELPDVKAKRAAQIARVAAGDLSGVMRDEMKPNYLSHGPGRAQILDLCMDMALELGEQVFFRQSFALRDRADQQKTLAAFNGPALVLMGEDDMLCPRDRHELMHALMPQSRLVIVKGAAHLPTLEKPEETAAALILWLNEKIQETKQ
jgi:pimeloyl-ACP methyl ester carboxylesterase